MRTDPLLSGLVDLLLPTACAGCRAEGAPLRSGVCAGCAAELDGLRPRPVRPTPAPPGLPPCTALGEYAGVLREALLAYKERGRHGLGRPLGALLAEVVAAAVGTPRPTLLVPVPSTARAVRARHGDHLDRIVRSARRRLVAAGWPVTALRPVRALPRPDSAGLDAAGRAAAAAAAFRIRRIGVNQIRRVASGRLVLVVDDIVTTGSTIAAMAEILAGHGVSVDAAAVLAATARRNR
ncbi:ComF family protein [Plantactinospora sp. KBS50]|uniref:ComF family protein n=1 Tax=Plantactinospora sp. KBS50 TaxID=2024580 RepID=UPI000BAB0D81|nr:phosphoribosyltransferase family protein [Plantactinospora sp. KBS50]ASW53735.1 phosphoribosyltransferase [Plantactinospora sp. KBS50]